MMYTITMFDKNVILTFFGEVQSRENKGRGLIKKVSQRKLPNNTSGSHHIDPKTIKCYIPLVISWLKNHKNYTAGLIIISPTYFYIQLVNLELLTNESR